MPNPEGSALDRGKKPDTMAMSGEDIRALAVLGGFFLLATVLAFAMQPFITD